MSSQPSSTRTQEGSIGLSPASTSPQIANSVPTSTTSPTPVTGNTQPTTSPQLSTSPKSSLTASSSLSSPSAAKTSTGTSSLSPGGVVGIGIGCAIIASLLTVTIMLLLRRKQPKPHLRHSRSRKGRTHVSSETKEEEKLPPSRPRAAFADPKSGIDAFLPQQADDATIRQKMLIVFDQVELHVDNFYVDNAVELTPEQEAGMSKFGTPTLSEPLAALLETSKRKTTLIKHCLAFYVVSLVSPTKPSRVLLPYELATMLAVADQQASESRVRDQNTSLALSRWRMLTAYLRPDLFSDAQLNGPNEADRLRQSALSFSQGFAPFANRGVEEQKVQHLVEVLRTAVQTALWLLTQPSVFEFDWTPTPDVRDRSGRAVLTVPALWKTHDQNGGRLDRPQVMLGGTTRLP